MNPPAIPTRTPGQYGTCPGCDAPFVNEEAAWLHYMSSRRCNDKAQAIGGRYG